MANNQVLYGGFRRLSNFPLDPTSVFKTKAEMEAYLQNSMTAYEGQQIVVTKDPMPENNGLYTVHVKEHPVSGVQIFTTRQAIDVERAVEIINTKVSIANQALEEDIKKIENYLGITEDDSPEVSSSPLLERISRIEQELLIADSDKTNDISIRLKNLEEKINEGLSSTDTIIKITKDIENLKAIVELLDDGKNNSSLNELLNILKETNIEKIEERIGNLETEVALLKASASLVVNLNTQVGVISNSIQTINNNISDIITRTSNLETKTDTLDQNIVNLGDELEKKEKTINENISSINNKITELTAKVNENSGSVEKVLSATFSNGFSLSLPKNSIITEIKVIVGGVSSVSDFRTLLQVETVSKTSVVSIDEIHLEKIDQYEAYSDHYIFDTYIPVDSGTLKIFRVWQNNSISDDLKGAMGKVFVKYYLV